MRIIYPCVHVFGPDSIRRSAVNIEKNQNRIYQLLFLFIKQDLRIVPENHWCQLFVGMGITAEARTVSGLSEKLYWKFGI